MSGQSQRRPVNYPLTGAAADAFRERTIEARATTEEAVVSKEARVVEEIGLRKEASDRVETVRDTVRETKVDVEQEAGGAASSGRGVGTTGYAAGTAGNARAVGEDLRDNPITRAVDDVAGTNVSGERPDQADGTPANPKGNMASRAVDKTLGTNISGANPNKV
ncbi:MAG TPA: YsnF/AvaK domain-containing protein [Gaiellales bacterium]|nr:YsnF/AvaK domain-containing protein [Gaiellales bacterium]